MSPLDFNSHDTLSARRLTGRLTCEIIITHCVRERQHALGIFISVKCNITIGRTQSSTVCILFIVFEFQTFLHINLLKLSDSDTISFFVPYHSFFYSQTSSDESFYYTLLASYPSQDICIKVFFTSSSLAHTLARQAISTAGSV